MDRRSWLWRRKSSEKSPGEIDSSGSVSSHSERYSDDQEALRASPINDSPNHAQSPEDSSNTGGNEVRETVMSLTEKLSAALLKINAKEDLVKQHAKVAEEAVSGWEKAETEVAALKQQLESASQKNSALEGRISHLDGALKECVRQLRQLREEQENKLLDAVVKKTSEWESNKFELENKLVELNAKLEAAKAEAVASMENSLQSKLEATEKENADLKVKLYSQSEELKLRTLEKELSNQAAEAASKQHLEGIKKVAKLEAECCRLRAIARRTSSANDHRPISNSVCVESLTDSQSDSGERSDSWTSALIAELNQFKNEKVDARNLTTSSMEIDLMDDFLEMERLVALPEAETRSSSFGLEGDSDLIVARDSLSKPELQEKVEKMESERIKLEMVLVDTRNRLETSCNHLTLTQSKLVELEKDLDSANESKQAAMVEVASMEASRKALGSQLEAARLEVGELQEKVALLEGKVEESALSTELTAKLEALEETREALESELHLAQLEVGKLREEVGLLEGQVEEERAKSAEFSTKAEALETREEALESRLVLANLEVRKLEEKVHLLEMKFEEESSFSREFTAKVEALESERKALESQVESEREEVGKLRDKVGLLEGKVDKESALSAQFAAKCRKLEAELLRKRQEAELRHVSSSNGELKTKQEKELAVAARKLSECQKTISSLGQQLKSLRNIDDFILDAEKPELNGCSTDLRIGAAKVLYSSDSLEGTDSFTLPNGKDRGFAELFS